MESQRVVVVVEDAAAARSALQWAVGNFIRSSDSITLLHVCPPARSRRKRRRLRLGGFQLALAFKDLCNGIAEVRTGLSIVTIHGQLDFGLVLGRIVGRRGLAPNTESN